MKGNSVSIKGNLTRDAEVRGKSGERSCVSFGLAWNNNWLRPDNSLQDQVHYFEVSCWMSPRQRKYFMPQLTKGATCSIIDGYLSYDTWQTKEGDKRSRVEISVVDPVSSMVLLAPRKPRTHQESLSDDTSTSASVVDAAASDVSSEEDEEAATAEAGPALLDTGEDDEDEGDEETEDLEPEDGSSGGGVIDDEAEAAILDDAD